MKHTVFSLLSLGNYDEVIFAYICWSRTANLPRIEREQERMTEIEIKKKEDWVLESEQNEHKVQNWNVCRNDLWKCANENPVKFNFERVQRLIF